MATAKKESSEKVAPKKTATKSATAKKTTEVKKAAPKKASKSAQASPAERYRMVEVAAYYIAEKNEFAGNATDYWIQAEIEINAKYPK
ncbi:MAG: DUF2934 domain-containing protein [Methylophilus sp.]|nr:DUF2934 domain-containing protein [Methylophilus sp.]MDP3608360.1 DUF2934 domain-containing protein [Methylophilus sp.]